MSNLHRENKTSPPKAGRRIYFIFLLLWRAGHWIYWNQQGVRGIRPRAALRGAKGLRPKALSPRPRALGLSGPGPGPRPWA